MAPGPSTLLSLALCLAQTARTQQGTLPRPSISAEPGSVVPWGRPVSIVCRGPAGVMSFRLEKGNRKDYKDVRVTSRGEQETEARFHITALREDAVGRYHCLYQKESTWSALSEALSLEGTEEAVSALPAAPTGLSTEQVYILIGVSVAFLLCLSLLVLLLLHRQLRRKRGPPRSKDEKQRRQGRLSPAVDVLDGTPDPCCRRLPGGDLRPAEPQAPHPESGQSCVPAVHRAPGQVQHVCNHCQTLTACPPGLCTKDAGSHTCKSPKWTLGFPVESFLSGKTSSRSSCRQELKS